MNKALIAIMLASGSLMLGGCQQFHSLFASKPARAETAAVDMSSYFTERLEAGRRHLEKGRPGQAVTAFRQASYSADTAGSAYNGMAIAYAQMGRDDLARRYFIAAIQADPTDDRFARNLARLDGGLPTAATEPALADTTTPATEPAANALPVPVASAPAPTAPAAGLVRTTDREVAVAPRSADSPRTTNVRVSARPQVASVASSRVTVEGRGSLNARSNYPVRLTLSEVPRQRQPSYPVRIELPQAK